MKPLEHLEENTLRYLQKWTRPDSYGGTEWQNHYVFVGQNRDSDALERSNFACAVKAMEKISPEYSGELAWGDDSGKVEPWTIVREGHWVCGWIEWIAIHKNAAKHLEAAAEIACALEDYPVIDEGHYSEIESEEAHTVWRDCYDVKDRVEYIRKFPDQFHFQTWQDMAGCVRGQYFSGYASDLLY